MSQHWLKPNWSPDLSLPSLPLQHLVEVGIESLILDVDRTLLPGREIVIPKSAKNWVFQAKRFMTIHLLSNNPSKHRIQSVANDLELSFSFAASKPRRKQVINVINILQKQPNQIAIIGDRIFTDILVGNRLNLYTVLVLPIKSDGTPSENQNVQKLEYKLAKWLGAK